ncbi:hypothetical protein BDV97DRAFT_104027 [Delphinella strobiligena]|nr:hypothetical protein BDV97DRAFT_104027 [Delphinella strobiligena]
MSQMFTFLIAAASCLLFPPRRLPEPGLQSSTAVAMESSDYATCSSPPSTLFVELPNELLSNIFEHFVIRSSSEIGNKFTKGCPSSQKIKDLAAICRTCKRFNVFTTPLLYQTFAKPRTLISQNGGNDVVDAMKLPANLRPFLRTISQRPDLAKLVKIVSLGTWELQKGCRRHVCTTQPLDTELKTWYSQAVSKFVLRASRQRQWVADLSSGQEDAEVALLFCLLENVQDLSIQLAACSKKHTGEKEDFLYWSVLQAALPDNCTKGIHPFASLKSISIHSFGNTGEVDYEEFPHPYLSQVWNIPSLEECKLFGELDYWTGNENYPTDSKIRSMQLHTCGLPTAAITRMAASCAKLETVRIVYDEYDQSSALNTAVPQSLMQESVVTWRSIVAALSSKCHSLNLLHLDALYTSPLTEVEYFEEEDEFQNATVGSLQHFTALKHLYISEIALLGPHFWWIDPAGNDINESQQPDLVDLLPPTLESLTLKDCTSAFLAQLEDLAQRCPVKLPSLRQISIQPPYIDPAGKFTDVVGIVADEDRFEKLEKGFVAAGVTWVDLIDGFVEQNRYFAENELGTDSEDDDEQGTGQDSQNSVSDDSSSDLDLDMSGEEDEWEDEESEDDISAPSRSFFASMMAAMNDGDEEYDDMHSDDFSYMDGDFEMSGHHPFAAALGDPENEYRAAINAWVDGWRPCDGF